MAYIAAIAEFVAEHVEQVTAGIDEPTRTAGPQDPDERSGKDGADAGEDHPEVVVVGEFGEAGRRAAAVKKASDPVRSNTDGKHREQHLDQIRRHRVDAVAHGIEDAADPTEDRVEEPTDRPEERRTPSIEAVTTSLSQWHPVCTSSPLLDDPADDRADQDKTIHW